MDESTDAYDTVDWLIHNVAGNNGRVGVLGVSYPGFLATMAGINPHPAVKAVSPQAPMTDTWMGDDFFHQGAFRLSYGFEYAGDLELSKDESVAAARSAPGTPTTGTARSGRSRTSTRNTFTAKCRPGRRSSPIRRYDALLEGARGSAWPHVARGADARRSAAGGIRKTATVRWRPTARSSAGDSAHRNFLVMGPWNHGGWRRGEPRRMPVVDPGTSEGYLRDVEAPWFAYWLKDKGKLSEPEAYLYDTGAKRVARVRQVAADGWRVAAQACTCTPADGSRSTRRRQARRAFDQYVSDPAHPVPYRPAADRADVRPARLALAHVGDGRPAIRGRPPGRGELDRPSR